ncbi:MAG: hypothetical protein MO852_03355, partial [Candidatus Devosia euplotis]|nr:hypothetical protein [Candidatus Devosia euplotis]
DPWPDGPWSEVSFMPIARWHIIALFFVHALAIGAIHTHTPDIQLLVGLSDAQLGLVLMGRPLGALGAFLFSSRIIELFGPRRVILVLLPLVTVSAALVTVLLKPVAIFILLAINGVGFSLTNIAINVKADRIEAATEKRIMNRCHGVWSFGFLLTSLLGAGLRGLDVAPAVHLWLLTPPVVVLVLIIVVPMPVAPPRSHAGVTRRRLAWSSWATLGLAAFGLGAGLTEGASHSWPIIYLRDNFEVALWIESMALPALLVTMAVGRLPADR